MASLSDNSGFKLSKIERVSGKLRIANLYNNSQIKFPEYPLFLAANIQPSSGHDVKLALLTVVSSKKFKSAVDRNKIKRLLKEAFRLNKPELLALLTSQKLDADISLGYMPSSIMSFDKINSAFIKLIPKLNAELEKHTG